MKKLSFVLILSIVGLFLFIACASPATPTATSIAAPTPTATSIATPTPVVDSTPANCEQAAADYSSGKPNLRNCELQIAVENAYQPFNYIDVDSGTGIGFDYDIFAAICGEINCEPVFVETTWDTMVAVMAGQSANTGLFDVGADGISITEKRANFVDFSKPYIVTEQTLLVAKDESRFSTADEFKNDESLIVGTQSATTNFELAEKLYGDERIRAYDQFGPAIQALIVKDVDAVIIDNTAGIGYVGVNADKLRTLPGTLQSDPLGFIYSKNSNLVKPIDWALDQLKSNGKLDEIIAEWFKDTSTS